MKTTKAFDEAVKAALQKESDKIVVTKEAEQRMMQGIERELQRQEEKEMKHFSMKKVAIGTALACVLISGMAFAGNVAGYRTGYNPMTANRSFDKMEETEREFGAEVKYVEKFSNGYQFTEAAVTKVDAVDENGNVLYEYPEMYISYDKGGASGIALSIYSAEQAENIAKAPDATKVYGDIALRYDEYTFKFVPVDYEFTEEDKVNVTKDNYSISYGADKVEVKKSSHVSWVSNGQKYLIQGFDLGMSSEELFTMAQEIIDAK